MCMFVICMLCTEKRKDAGGYANKAVTTMPVTKKRQSTSASYSSAASTASTSSTASSGSAISAYGTTTATALGAASIIPFGNMTCNIMNTTTAAPQLPPPPPHTTRPLASVKCNIVQKTVSPAVVFQELPPRYRAWL